MTEKTITKTELIIVGMFIAFLGGLLTFVTLRDSCFNHSYAMNFPQQCK